MSVSKCFYETVSESLSPNMMDFKFTEAIMQTNYHTHTPHCGHAAGESTADYAKAAFSLGLKVLGFSDHAAFPDTDFGYRMSFEEMNVYFDEVDELRKEYAPQGMEIYKGLEIEYLPEYLDCKLIPGGNYYEYLLNEKKLDYLLCGEHFFRTREGNLLNLYNIDSSELVIDYALACKEAMETGYFKVLAHPDLFGVNDFPWDDNIDKASDIIIETAIKTGSILEFNANGYRRGIKHYTDCDRLMYPLENFWKKIPGTGIQIIIGSDSHNMTEIIDYAIDKAEEKLAELGITPIDRL